MIKQQQLSDQEISKRLFTLYEMAIEASKRIEFTILLTDAQFEELQALCLENDLPVPELDYTQGVK